MRPSGSMVSVVFFMASIAARFLVTFLLKKSFFGPSREVPLGGLFSFFYSFFFSRVLSFFLLFIFSFFHFLFFSSFFDFLLFFIFLFHFF